MWPFTHQRNPFHIIQLWKGKHYSSNLPSMIFECKDSSTIKHINQFYEPGLTPIICFRIIESINKHNKNRHFQQLSSHKIEQSGFKWMSKSHHQQDLHHAEQLNKMPPFVFRQTHRVIIVTMHSTVNRKQQLK